jgi:predicted nucleotidyltransferase
MRPAPVRRVDERLGGVVDSQPYPLLFATISGADLYGFPSLNSDWDLRGVHILPVEKLLGLERGPETVEDRSQEGSFELDLVTHDVGKFFGLLLRKNGYVLEQLYSPLVVATTPEHQELKEIARDCITRHHVYHYQGFARTQRRLLVKQNPPTVKTLLYVYRVLLTGLHLMRTGEVEANLVHLNEEMQVPQLGELIARKQQGGEACSSSLEEVEAHELALSRLEGELHLAFEASVLPEEATAKPALHDLLLRIRLRQF